MKVYKGCDVIDINPGIGLWSSKIHKYLRPRRHILVEPATETYKEFIQPLLKSQESRYVLADWKNRHDPWDLNRFLTEGLLPERKGLGTSKEQKLNPNTSLLILANLGYNLRSFKSGHRDESSPLRRSFFRILDYLESIEGSHGLHRNGRVRMLMWLLDPDKGQVVPRCVAHRRKLSVRGEDTCHIEEIVGRPFDLNAQRRETTIDVKSSELVSKRMRDNGIAVPLSRLDSIAKRTQSGELEPCEDNASAREGNLEAPRDWHVELKTLEDAFANHEYSQFVGGPPGIKKGARKTRSLVSHTPQYERLQLLQRIKRSQNNRTADTEALLKLQDEIEAEHLAICLDNRLDREARMRKLEVLDRRIEDYHSLLRNLTPDRLRQLYLRHDDRKAWCGDSSLLMWDRRLAEPIIPRDDEILNAPMALLDFQPKLSVSNLTKSQQSYRDAIVTGLFAVPRLSIVKALESLAPGAANAVVPLAPSLRDPTRGGQRDLTQLRVRVLTPEMITEVAVAFDKWLFKPTVPELSKRVLSANRASEGAR